ncbi:MAG: molybdenum cofactor biosynthesis protein MoaE [Gemmatimonadaceae bacterium]|nr:molybdenum cofactor biosynthesis protein MoaE [Gemmatimonadaceae bacterium]
MRTGLVGASLDLAAIAAEVASPANGALSLFVGTVRDTNDGRSVDGIEYNAYAPMAEREMADIAAEAAEQFGTAHIVIEHRTGYLALGEASVVIAVAHPRRANAMDATRWIIEALKLRVPIWKLEHYTDGTRQWVEHGGVQGAGSQGEVRGEGLRRTSDREAPDA